MSKNKDKKKKGGCAKWLLVILAIFAIAGGVFMYFGGFGTGESADPKEFSKYAGAIDSIEIPDGVAVVALGEATHGNREFQQLKLDVFKIMAEKYGVRTFAIEGDLGCCEAVNRYIHGGEGTPEQAAADIGFAIYRTEETAALIEYMRDFNKTAAQGDDMRFYGFDMQRGGKSLSYLVEECEKLGVDAGGIKALVDGNDWSSRYDYSQRKAAFESVKAALLSKEDSSFAVRLADVLIQNCEFFSLMESGADGDTSNALRDSYMKENILWIAAQEKDRGFDRIFISGHSGHVKRLSSYKNTGSLLAEELGSGYYVIGTEFYKTRCNLPSGTDGKRANHTFFSRDPLAKAAKKAGYDIRFLDFSKIPEDSSLRKYTSEYIYNGSLGEVYSYVMPFIPMTYRAFDDPEISYDGMIYVANATPTEIK